MLLFLLPLVFAQPPCSVPITNADLSGQMDSIELGFVVADMQKIETSMKTLEQSIPCLHTRLLPEEAARYHILKGLHAWISQNEDEMRRSFSVARKTNPQANISTHIFPEGHMIHDLYAEITPASYEEVTTTIKKGDFCFDGYMLPRRPASAPTILQVIDNKKILYSAYLSTDEPIPEWKQQKTYHKPIALGAAAISLIIGAGLQLDSQLERISYENHTGLIAKYQDDPAMLAREAEILDNIYQNHNNQFRNSMIAFLTSAGLVGVSFALEW